MTVRFFILQTHYRSTLDFSNEALQAAEKGLKRLMEAYEWLKQLSIETLQSENKDKQADPELNEKVMRLLNEFEAYMNDDFSTAKVLANIFELVPVINSLKDKNIDVDALPTETLYLLQQKIKVYVENILGLKAETVAEEDKLKGVMEVLISIRKEARARKDWATSDKIRNQLADAGILLKDEKDGGMSWTTK